jgi:hypothetical protein
MSRGRERRGDPRLIISHVTSVYFSIALSLFRRGGECIRKIRLSGIRPSTFFRALDAQNSVKDKVYAYVDTVVSPLRKIFLIDILRICKTLIMYELLFCLYY